MLRDDAIDVVYVATPIALHGEHGRRVLEAGKHLWCDKPLATSRDAVLQLLERSARLGLVLCEGHMYLHHPQFQWLRSYVTEGRLGRVTSIECRFGIPRLEQPGFRSDPSLGGGALPDSGVRFAVHACFPRRPLTSLTPVSNLRRVAADTGQACSSLNSAVAFWSGGSWLLSQQGSMSGAIALCVHGGIFSSRQNTSRSFGCVTRRAQRQRRARRPITSVLMLQNFNKMIDEQRRARIGATPHPAHCRRGMNLVRRAAVADRKV